MKRILLSLLLVLFCTATYAEEKPALTPEQFVKIVRTPPGRESWGLLEGVASHRRRGSATAEAPLRFSVIFTKARTIAQIVFNNKEVYDVAQSYLPPFAGSIDTRDLQKGKSLKDFGLRPEDLTMNFIFWPLKKELKRESIKTVDCRVMVFESPTGKESVKVFISAGHFFPLKVEWYNVPADRISGDAFRTLEVNSFKKSGELWVLGSFSIYGPGWRTSVKFPETKAGLTKDGVAKDLFR